MLQRTEAILLDKRMLPAMTTGIGELPDALCAYLFQHYLRPFNVPPFKKKSYYKIIMQQYSEAFPSQIVDASTLSAVLEKMFQFITDMEHGLNPADMKRFDPLMGPELERAFTAHVRKYLFYRDDFNRSEFEGMLAR